MDNLESMRATRKHVADIGAATGNSFDDGLIGYLYSDSVGYVGVIYDRPTDDPQYHVIAEASEYSTNSLKDAESWLWHNWAKFEYVA